MLCPHRGYYYGVDVTTFHPATADERDGTSAAARSPQRRLSHHPRESNQTEKDPETVASAVAAARGRGSMPFF